MKIKFRLSCFLIMLLMILSQPVFAKLVNGPIKSLDTATRKVVLETLDPATGKSEEFVVWVSEKTSLEGFNELSQLSVGDLIWIEASPDMEGNFQASKLVRD